MKMFGAIRGPFSAMLHSPRLVEISLEFNKFFGESSVVAGKDRSMAILTSVRIRQAAYVWAAQASAAAPVGVAASLEAAALDEGRASALEGMDAEALEQLRPRDMVGTLRPGAVALRHLVDGPIETEPDEIIRTPVKARILLADEGDDLVELLVFHGLGAGSWRDGCGCAIPAAARE